MSQSTASAKAKTILDLLRSSPLDPRWPLSSQLIGNPLLDGSTFTDSSNTSNQIVIDETLANTLWPGERAVGERLRLGGMIAVVPRWWPAASRRGARCAWIR